MNLAATLPATLLLAACVATSEPEIPGCYEGPCVAIGESQQLPGIEVVPLEVLEDSRCPIEAECVWSGELRLHVQLTLGHEVITSEITTLEPMIINGGALALVEAAPDASSQWPDLSPEDYRFRFEFTPE